MPESLVRYYHSIRIKIKSVIKNRQAGFTILELILASAIAVVVASIGGALIYQVFTENHNVSNQLVAGYQLDRAGYWISSDTQMADSVTTLGLTPPDIVVLGWTDWGINTDSISHSATYSITGISNNTGKLIRHYQDSNGADQSTQIAEDIYYNTADPANSTQLNYANGLLSFKITTKIGTVQYSRTYTVYPRPNYMG